MDERREDGDVSRAANRAAPVAPGPPRDPQGSPGCPDWIAAARRALSRRDLLLLIGGAGASLAFGGRALERVSAAADVAAWSDDVARSGSHGMRQWVMVIDLRRCDGCRKCTKACQTMHSLPGTQEWIRVFELTDAAGRGYFMPVPCQQCDNAPCVRVCPVGATFVQDDGAIVVDQSVCIGCRMCMAACPYGARTFNWEAGPVPPDGTRSSRPEFTVPQRQGTVGKCTLCVHRTREGKLPACVEGCPMRAIYIGDLEADVATNGPETVVLTRFLHDNDAFRFREDLGTEPRVYYIAGHGQEVEY